MSTKKKLKTFLNKTISASCARDQFACVKSGTCIPAKLRCDGHADDCADGSNLDEIGCSKNESELHFLPSLIPFF
jgi:hypothetical protein